MSPPGCPKMSAKPCNRNAEESFPVLSLTSREQKPPNPLLIQDKNVLQPSQALSAERCDATRLAPWPGCVPPPGRSTAICSQGRSPSTPSGGNAKDAQSPRLHSYHRL